MGAWVGNCVGYIAAAGIYHRQTVQAVQHCSAAGELVLLHKLRHLAISTQQLSSMAHLQDLTALPQAAVKDFLQSLLRNPSVLKVRFAQQLVP